MAEDAANRGKGEAEWWWWWGLRKWIYKGGREGSLVVRPKRNVKLLLFPYKLSVVSWIQRICFPGYHPS